MQVKNIHLPDALEHIAKTSLNSPRLLSITFDDGLKQSTDIAISILNRYGLQATFYVVTGWVEPVRTDIKEPFNIGRSHGSWDYWRQVVAMGHEVGSHSYSHVNALGKKAWLFPWLVPSEIAKSYRDLNREIPQASYTMAMPWNAATWFSDFFVRRSFSACRLGTSDIEYNNLASLNRYRLKSWAPSQRNDWPDYVKAIDGVRAGGWLILQFHGFDDEGWDPIASELFEKLCEYISKCDLQVASVQKIIERCTS